MITLAISNISKSETGLLRDWVLNLLHNENVNNLNITFRKCDGTECNIKHGTLLSSVIPYDKMPHTSRYLGDVYTQRVFDVDLGEWKTLRWDRINQISFKLSPN